VLLVSYKEFQADGRGCRKMSDGMFLTACRAVAKDYPKIKYSEDLLDRVCLRIATDPSPFEKNVMVMPNL
jgi:isocitrate dehydrogenase (NAD+)